MRTRHVTLPICRDVDVLIFLCPDPKESCAGIIGKTAEGDTITLSEDERCNALELAMMPSESDKEIE
jgi:hypothetical protein